MPRIGPGMPQDPSARSHGVPVTVSEPAPERYARLAQGRGKVGGEVGDADRSGSTQGPREVGGDVHGADRGGSTQGPREVGGDVHGADCSSSTQGRREVGRGAGGACGGREGRDRWGRRGRGRRGVRMCLRPRAGRPAVEHAYTHARILTGEGAGVRLRGGHASDGSVPGGAGTVGAGGAYAGVPVEPAPLGCTVGVRSVLHRWVRAVGVRSVQHRWGRREGPGQCGTTRGTP
jgi:hypothetical protein